MDEQATCSVMLHRMQDRMMDCTSQVHGCEALFTHLSSLRANGGSPANVDVKRSHKSCGYGPALACIQQLFRALKYAKKGENLIQWTNIKIDEILPEFTARSIQEHWRLWKSWSSVSLRSCVRNVWHVGRLLSKRAREGFGDAVPAVWRLRIVAASVSERNGKPIRLSMRMCVCMCACAHDG
jgi:hypothetical protein